CGRQTGGRVVRLWNGDVAWEAVQREVQSDLGRQCPIRGDTCSSPCSPLCTRPDRVPTSGGFRWGARSQRTSRCRKILAYSARSMPTWNWLRSLVLGGNSKAQARG